MAATAAATTAAAVATTATARHRLHRCGNHHLRRHCRYAMLPHRRLHWMSPRWGAASLHRTTRLMDDSLTRRSRNSAVTEPHHGSARGWLWKTGRDGSGRFPPAGSSGTGRLKL